MNYRLFQLSLLAGTVLIAGSTFSRAADPEDLEALAAAQGDQAKVAAVLSELQQDDELELLSVLSAMKGKNAVIKNWYLALAQSVADRDAESSKEILDQYLTRLSEDPDGRYWAFRYVTQGDDEKRAHLLDSMLADPSLELRYEAVERALQQVEASGVGEAARLSRFRELLAAARLPAQVQSIAEQLKELGQEVNLLDHFGFLSTWQTIGPFDNVGSTKFDEAYQPEKSYLAASTSATMQGAMAGKSGEVSWEKQVTEADDGAVDLNAIYNNEKGAVVYAFSVFKAADAISCQARLGSPNACKVWVNGKQIMGREVYHAGNQIDQYIAPVDLKAGINTVLVKVCQNEQKEPWAQDWLFQLRFTDATGLAIGQAE